MPSTPQRAEDRLQEALAAYQLNPEVKLAQIAREFNVPYYRLRARLKGRPSKIGLPSTTKLSQPQEIALCNYIDRLDRINLAVRKELIQSAANFILKESTQPGQEVQQVGVLWVNRFIKRHKYHCVPQKVLDMERQQAENLEAIHEWYLNLQAVVEEYGIQPGDIWNMDETGFCIGVGRDQLVVTRRKRAHYFGIPTNRESATAVEAISATGDYLPAFLILSGAVHLSRWYEVKNLEEDTMIAVSSSGYSNDELPLAWIQHFEKHTVKRTVGSKRLLLLDGYGSHHTIEFIGFCQDHSIIPFGLPPHTTHILQPLDVVVFQPLKHYHAKAIDLIIREGCINITKLEFLGYIQEIRKQAFKRETILSAFRKTGIHPFNPQPVLQLVQTRNPQPRTPSPPPKITSSPVTAPIGLARP
jgi:hypothetical protein